jgi:hypothetical protein
MGKNFNSLAFIKGLIRFSPRQLENEKRAADFIISVLRNYHIDYQLDYFFTRIPRIKRAILRVDKKEIPCKACSFVSGKIKDKDFLISSLIPSRFFIEEPNINFNPKCSVISLSNFYFAPAIAISREKISSILRAKNIEGEVRVRPVRHKSLNILVGNTKNPKTISFAHYDSLEKGVVDNASGVAVLMEAIFSKREITKDHLLVFAGNEELSYDKPTYWGYGFRVFEKKFFKIIERAEKIIVIDSLGNGRTRIFRDDNLIYLAFPILNRKKWKRKIEVIAGDIQKLMTVYHSDADDLTQIRQRYITEATKQFLREISLR